MGNPKVSVIIPAHNEEKLIGRCLKSVLSQTYKNYEVIVVDNNSADLTGEIVRKFQKKDESIKYTFESYRSRGAARNKGIQEAAGDIIAMTDSDCVVPKDWLANLTRPIREKNEYAVQGNEVDSIGNYWARMQQEFNQDFIKSCRGEKYIDHLDTKNFSIKKDVLEKVGMFNPSTKNLEDFELKVRLKQQGYKIFFLTNCHVEHSHKDTFVSLFLKRIDQGFWATKIYFQHKSFFDEYPEEMVKSISVKYFFIFFPWLLFYWLIMDFNKFYFELVSGVSWRIGIIFAVLDGVRLRAFSHE